MIYSIAVCDQNLERKKRLMEMLHVFSNEFGREFNITEYEDESVFLSTLDHCFYQIIFVNILQAGSPGELDLLQDIHLKNKGTVLVSLCPRERYVYYRDLAQEFSFLKEPFQYKRLKTELMRAIKEIDLRENQEESGKKYIRIHLKRKIEWIEIERITYIERVKYGVIVHTLDRDFYSFEPCKEIYEKLKTRAMQFIETDKKHIINFNLLYDMEKIEVNKKKFRKGKRCFFAVMTGYAHVPVKEIYYESLFRRFVNEIVRGRELDQNLSKISMENM